MDTLNIYILTFNCARNPVNVDLFATHLFDALPRIASSSTPPELIVLCLQEIAPIAYAFLGGSYLTPYFKALGHAVDRAVGSRWDETQYVNLVTDNTGMTGLMVFARSDVADRVSSVDTARVGLGVQQMGNKGAVAARLSYPTGKQTDDAVDITFIAAHLAPFEYAFERRNEDWRGIVERLVFSGKAASRGSIEEGEADDSESATLLRTPSSNSSNGIFTPTGYLFLAGDLNYRTSDTLPLKGDHSRFPQLDADPSSHLHYSHLLKEDQLTREMQKSRCFHGLSEAPITFPPTYKYKEPTHATRDNTPEGWKWTTTRWPSWCDRILYLETPPWIKGEAKVTPHMYNALPLFPTSDHRPVALSVSVSLQSIPEPRDVDPATDVRLEAPFPIDPDWERKRNDARRKELIVGILAYLGLTREGNRLLLMTIIGIVGAWLVLKSLWSF